MKHIIVQSKIKDYRVKFEENFKFLERLGKTKCVLMVDKNVYELYGKIINKNFNKKDILIIEAIESNKTINKAIEIYRYLIEKSAKRSISIISLGGGIIQDITGFVGSTLYRGVNWIFIPTTLLSQTDSCIGSKTSLNFDSYKNLVGTFYPPTEVYINVDFLQTLKESDFYSGMGEVIKLQLMKKQYPKKFEKVVKIINKAKTNKLHLSKLIKGNLKVKYSYFQNDEFDLGERNLLNYGHCFGHAIETSSDYYVPHGTAVIIGMIFSHIISLKRRLISDDVFDYLNANLLIPNIKLKLKREHFGYGVLLDNIRKDKKRIGDGLALILPNSEFKMFKITDLSEKEFKKGIELLLRILFE
ncbi:MAG: AroB-related putative sugar phosphate phospholyase (cyclizing) [Planctomycetota bacterium]